MNVSNKRIITTVCDSCFQSDIVRGKTIPVLLSYTRRENERGGMHVKYIVSRLPYVILRSSFRDVRYNYRIKRTFGGGLMPYLRYLCLFAHSGDQHILWFFFILSLSSSILPVYLDCPFLTALPVISNIYLRLSVAVIARW